MATTAESRPVSVSQYHHYVPRFLLRRFSTPSPTTRKHNKKRNSKQPDDDVVNAVDLARDTAEFVTLPVRRMFGQVDMYKDDSAFSETDQHRIERKLSAIEGDASRIVAKVVDAHKAGKEEVSLSRHEKDLLRKFIFVMKYRSPIFYQRFNHQKAEDYDSDDRASFLAYMRERGFQRPLDVWFDNLLKIIDKPMDPSGKWTEDLSNHIYPGDAEWLFRNIRSMYLSFVIPSDGSEEFLLTNNAFGIYEGPADYSIDPSTGKQTISAYTEFHVISVVSPHLVMILRHNLLPEPLEDQRESVRDQKKVLLALYMQAHGDPDNATSLLQDLPVNKARNSYTIVHNGRLELAQGESGVPTAKDNFHFTLFRLGSRHVQTINLIMLDQAHTSSYIVFKSKVALRAALDFYLDFPTRTRGTYSLKTITERPDDPMLLSLRKLEKIAYTLGSSVKAKYHIDPLVEIKDAPPAHEAPASDEEASLDEIVSQVLRTATTDFLAKSLADNIFALLMTVLMEVLTRLQMTVLSAHTLDLLLTTDDWLCFPDMVGSAVQKADTRGLSERTKGLVDVELGIWRQGWMYLVRRALQIPGVDLDHSVEVMRENLRRQCTPPHPHLASALASAVRREISRSPGVATVPRPGHGKDIQAAPEMSKQRLRHSFDDVDHTVQNNGSVNNLALFAFFVVVLMCFCLAVLAWRLICLARSLVVGTWHLTVLVWNYFG
ncbi:hypothetical protein G6011_08677 [Alternaria panax]|uniref:DUF4238 domain-containing protein n=1 Tax=Alternaria panax TaxID=48097 RepID=A0AAD4IA05_9PLEO|nr:hypothetical protein G6011_08677 [Alternaria panax]